MENVLTITNLKQNILEFTAGIEGLNDNDMIVRLIIEANGMDISFDAKRLQGTSWEVIIPPLPMLEKTAYPFRMDVVSEGYFFAPLKGVMNVVGTHELYVTDPKSRSIPPKEVEGLPIKHYAKPQGTKEVEDSKDKVSPKVLKPIKPTMGTARDPNIADIAARLKAMRDLPPKVGVDVVNGKKADAEEIAVVVDAERKEEKKDAVEVKHPAKTVKKLEVGGAKTKKVEEDNEDGYAFDIDDIIERAKKKARVVAPPEEEKIDGINDEPTAEEPEKEIEVISKPEVEEPKDKVKSEPLITSTPKKVEIKKRKLVIKEPKDEDENDEFTFESALEKVKKAIPKKKRAPRKVSARKKAGTIKKLTDDKEIVQKPEEEVVLEAKKEDAVKDILSEDNETKKVITHPVKKGGKITIH